MTFVSRADYACNLSRPNSQEVLGPEVGQNMRRQNGPDEDVKKRVPPQLVERVHGRRQEAVRELVLIDLVGQPLVVQVIGDVTWAAHTFTAPECCLAVLSNSHTST